MTSIWTNNEDNCEFQAWRAWGSRTRKKQFEFFMGPKDRRSTTWYLNWARFRTWDHFLVRSPRSKGVNSKLRSVSMVRPDGRPSLKQRRPSSKNLCSASGLTTAKSFHVRLKSEKDWSFYMTGWWVLLQRLKLPRLLQGTGTGTNLVCLRRSGRWHLMQPIL